MSFGVCLLQTSLQLHRTLQQLAHAREYPASVASASPHHSGHVTYTCHRPDSTSPDQLEVHENRDSRAFSPLEAHYSEPPMSQSEVYPEFTRLAYDAREFQQTLEEFSVHAQSEDEARAHGDDSHSQEDHVSEHSAEHQSEQSSETLTPPGAAQTAEDATSAAAVKTEGEPVRTEQDLPQSEEDATPREDPARSQDDDAQEPEPEPEPHPPQTQDSTSQDEKENVAPSQDTTKPEREPEDEVFASDSLICSDEALVATHSTV